MDYVRLGKSGLKVSRLCLGCMTYGEPDRGGHPWTLGEAESRGLISHAVDVGINFFDTANVYSDGSSEEIVGRALRDFGKRDEFVIATKLHSRMHKHANGAGLSRKAVMAEIDASLKRLQTDYVDLYQIHRWDYETPIEETMEALHDAVKAGKALYVGASSMYVRQFARSLHVADLRNWTRFVSMQNHYNLLYREEEREMLPLCLEEGIGVMPWSPLARGRLARAPDVQETARSRTDGYARVLYSKTENADRIVIDAVGAVAERLGHSRSQIALAWLLHKPSVTSPIIGASKHLHLDEAVAAASIKLSESDLADLERGYEPHAIVGFE